LDNTEAALDASEDAREGLHARIKEVQASPGLPSGFDDGNDND
jgi:hypothetical protein